MARQLDLEVCGPSLTREAIDAFEKEIDGRLPEDYRGFLMAHNGGLLLEQRLGAVVEGKVYEIGGFSSLMPPNDDSGLRTSLRRLQELNPLTTSGLMPIASTLGEEHVCIAYRHNVGEVFLTVYTYKKVFVDDLVPIGVRMAPLARSFTEFLDKLIEIPNPHCRAEMLGQRGTPDELAQYLAEGNSIDALGKNGLTILCEAVKSDNLSMIRACIERGASLSYALRVAVGNRRIHLIEMLVEAGADVNERDEYGDTPLSYVGGTDLPGEEGARNRALWNLLIQLGAEE